MGTWAAEGDPLCVGIPYIRRQNTDRWGSAVAANGAFRIYRSNVQEQMAAATETGVNDGKKDGDASSEIHNPMGVDWYLLYIRGTRMQG